MVRVCVSEECTKPHHIFGCIYYTGEAESCDDCKEKRVRLYERCSIRRVKPASDDATHGFCRHCASQVMHQRVQKQYRNNSRHTSRRKKVVATAERHASIF
jgi:hypothetical protein